MNPAALLAAIILAGSAAQAATVERIVARVNRDIITQSELDDTVKGLLAQSKSKADQATRDRMASEVLERMISDRLIIQSAAADGLKVTETEVAPEVDRQVAEIRASFKTSREFDAQLRKEGITLDDLRARLTARARDQYMFWKQRNRKQRELEMSIDIPEEDLKTYAEAHASDKGWLTEPEVRARHIQFTVKDDLKGDARKAALAEAMKKAEAARASLKRGESFEDVARLLSEDTATRENGGDLGTFSRGSFDASIEKAAFGLKPGEVSAPVESPAGIHLVKVEQVIKPHAKTLDDKVTVPSRMPPGPGGEQATEEITLREHIRGILRNEKLSGAFQRWVDSLHSTALIQRFPEAPAGK